MPRFYFDIHENGKAGIDGEGIELDSLAHARAEAQRTLAEMAAESFRRRDEVILVIEIRTEAGGKCIEAVASSSIRDV